MKSLVACALILSSFAAPGQNTYFVLNVKGKVVLEKTKAALKPNDQVSDKDHLTFNSSTDAVAVISSRSGRMILRPKASARSSELVCLVGDILNPGTARLSTRGGGINNVIELRNYFGLDSLHSLGTTRVWISPVAFRMDATHFFFVRYSRKGEVINKKLTFESDSVILSAHELYRVDDQPISPVEVTDARLFYKQGDAISEVGPFAVSFPSEARIKQLVTVYKEHTSLKGVKFLDELNSLLKDIYGRTDKDNVHRWVRRNFESY